MLLFNKIENFRYKATIGLYFLILYIYEVNFLNHIIIYALVMLIVTLILYMIGRKNWEKSDTLFLIKKLVDCGVYCIGFILIVYTNYIVTSMGLNPAAFIGVIILSIVSTTCLLYRYTKEILSFRDVVIAQKKIFIFTFISLLVGILMSLATINYAIYMFWPYFYEIESGLSFFEIAFEFIYYSFTLAVTYSSSSISVTHVVTKLVQMIEMCYCYVVFGIIIIELISGLGNKKT